MTNPLQTSTKYDFAQVEEGVLDFWKRASIYPQVKSKNKKGQPWYFLEGPPYTSGKIHLGTAWNKSIKDMMLRYKRMCGFDVWDRAGYDMHGLPTENKVQKELGMKDKDAIEAYGMDKFVDQCEQFSLKYMKLMNEEFKRIGIWLDFDNPYMPITQEFIEGEWWLIKTAHEKNRLYEGSRPMTWCASCETAVAKHELEYEQSKDLSIYVKFPVEGEENTHLLIWTTTPWTIPFNLAVMVHPDFEYVKAQVDDEVWIVAKELAKPFIEDICHKTFTVLDTVKGKDLDGMRYMHPLHKDIPHYEELKLESKNVHSVVLSSEYVDLSAGTGLVHTAPGCGPQDYEVGVRNHIPAFNTIDEKGVFPKSMGKFAGLVAKTDDLEFMKHINDAGALAAKQKITHEYPHCWRCHKPIVFKATKQWFFKIEDLKEQMIEHNRQIKWEPQAAFNAFDSWLKNLRDNSISKQRYWGTPLPIWRCNKCDNYIVCSTVHEIEQKSGQKVEKLHKPWIDEITIPCSCGGTKHRVPDILDVWVDAGCASWNCLDYPQKQEDFERYFPADFIMEGKDQIRGWFNLLMVASTLTMNKPSFKSVYMHGFVQAADGRKMSKSLGNYISPSEVIDKHGADTLRYYMIGGAAPGLDIMYNFEDLALKYRNLHVLWNVHNFILDLSKTTGLTPQPVTRLSTALEERYILSLMHTTIKKVTAAFEAYHFPSIPQIIEHLFLELSRTYIQAVRDKAANGTQEEKQTVLNVTHTVLMHVLKLFAPVAPFITEQMYQDFKFAYSLQGESIHLKDWPQPDENFIDAELEEHMAIAKHTIQSILSAREKVKLGVRWPIAHVKIVTTNKAVASTVTSLGEMIKTQTNIKELEVSQEFHGAHVQLHPNNRTIGQEFKQLSPKVVDYILNSNAKEFVSAMQKAGSVETILGDEKIVLKPEHITISMHAPEHYVSGDYKYGELYVDTRRNRDLDGEGFAREVMRRIQDLRKTTGLSRKDRVQVHVLVDAELEEMLNPWEEDMKQKCGITDLVVSQDDLPLKHKVEEKIKGKGVVVYLEQV